PLCLIDPAKNPGKSRVSANWLERAGRRKLAIRIPRAPFDDRFRFLLRGQFQPDEGEPAMPPSEDRETARQERINAIIADYLEAVEAGLAPDGKKFIQGHPDLAAELEAFFADQSRFAKAAGQLGPAPANRPPLPSEIPTIGLGDPSPVAPLGTV